MENRVAIIGAGISGLLACKYALEKGFNPIVFEADNGIGGVWAHTSETTELQTPKGAYQFCDFPWPSSVREDCPNHLQVLDYIRSYARHFGLLRCIKFDSKVVGIEYEGASEEEIASWSLWNGTGEPFSPRGRWSVLVQETLPLNQTTNKVYQVEFVVLCIGRFSGLPKFPDFPVSEGPEAFNGVVLHSMDYSAMDDAAAKQLVKGKRVVVVGNLKSGLDIAAECASANGTEKPCTLIYRTEHWSLPHFFPWGVPLAMLYMNRFSELLIHKPGEGLFLALLALIFSPLRWIISKFVESYMRWNFPLKKYKMIPKRSFMEAIASCTLAVMPHNFFNRVEEGSIVLKKSKILRFCKNGLIMEGGDGKPLEADIVIFATGYKSDEKLKNIFTSPTFQKHVMGSSTSTIPLYREIIHPRIPQLAVIGYSESIVNLHTSEMRSRWLAHFLEGNFKLPSIKEMEKDVLRWERYMKQYSGKHYRRASVSVIHIWYNDQLCKDMGRNHRRKKGIFAELFQPYGPLDYTDM